MASAELYCDASATTPPLKEVLEAMQETYANAWANPSSLHGHGLWLQRRWNGHGGWVSSWGSRPRTC